MLIQKERDDKLVSFIVICDKSFLLLFRKSEDGIAENLAALMRDNTLLLTQSQHLFVEEREVALADFVPMCQKIGGQPLGEDAYETSVSFEPCAKADFSLLAQTTIGTMEIKKDTRSLLSVMSLKSSV